mmetsp:Transcript_16867/g.55180  ORF Transcript_16867/g.55180 Transcript_16867/m.55180 type:complete len:214 (-) Transcript_16867:1556-2197(-)
MLRLLVTSVWRLSPRLTLAALAPCQKIEDLREALGRARKSLAENAMGLSESAASAVLLPPLVRRCSDSSCGSALPRRHFAAVGRVGGGLRTTADVGRLSSASPTVLYRLLSCCRAFPPPLPPRLKSPPFGIECGSATPLLSPAPSFGGSRTGEAPPPDLKGPTLSPLVPVAAAAAVVASSSSTDCTRTSHSPRSMRYSPLVGSPHCRTMSPGR